MVCEFAKTFYTHCTTPHCSSYKTFSYYSPTSTTSAPSAAPGPLAVVVLVGGLAEVEPVADDGEGQPRQSPILEQEGEVGRTHGYLLNFLANVRKSCTA